MSQRGLIRFADGAFLYWALCWTVAVAAGSSAVLAQEPPVAARTAVAAGNPSTTAATNVAQLPDVVQVVQFQVPEGVGLEVLGPPPEPIVVVAGKGSATFGLKVGVGYRLRLSNLTNRPGAELYPVLQVVGHLHRPPDVDSGRFPIRVVFSDLDLEDAVDRGRLVTQVVYLEDPDQALPLNLPKDETPVITLNSAEDPLRVGAALGRPMVIVRLGGRVPNPEEWSGAADLGLDPKPCPFSSSAGGRCPLPLGPARGTPPPPGHTWLPRDEYLCDGGDRGEAVHFGGDGSLRGIDPRDAVIRFQDDRRPRVLPTNTVCMYAPRFAAVRTSIGANEALVVEIPSGTESLERQVTHRASQEPRRLVQNQTADAYRHRGRPSGLIGRMLPAEFTELRVLHGYDTVAHIAGNILLQGSVTAHTRQKAGGVRGTAGLLTIKTAESAVLTGIIEGASDTVMAWKPEEIAGVELPPNRPGITAIKRVSAAVAEPGDVVTISIQYRNMGNVPIRAVSVVDSLMPRLEYVARSAVGPAGTVFSASENKAGSSELRWDLPGVLEPGKDGYVSFEAKVR